MYKIYSTVITCPSATRNDYNCDVQTHKQTHTHTHYLFPLASLFHALVSPLNFPPHHRRLTCILSWWLLVYVDGLIPRVCVCVCVCVCVRAKCSQVVQPQGNLCSVSGWRRGSACVASLSVTFCVRSCSLTVTEGVTCGTSWREESSCQRSVSFFNSAINDATSCT